MDFIWKILIATLLLLVVVLAIVFGFVFLYDEVIKDD